MLDKYLIPAKPPPYRMTLFVETSEGKKKKLKHTGN